MRKLNTRYSTVDLIIICLISASLILLSQTIGWKPIIIATTIIGLSIVIFLLLWKFIIKVLIDRTIKKRINTPKISSDGQIAIRYEDPDFWFIILLVVLLVVLIPSFILIFFGLGSVFITGITLIVLSILGAVISIEIPWPSWMTKRNLGFEIENKVNNGQTIKNEI
ncbi:MAG: hypothetical protein ACFFAU_12160 [Candidatus Hodarchaeota archaeon]